MPDQEPLGRMRVEIDGPAGAELLGTHPTLDEAVEGICCYLESGARLAGGDRLVIVDDETGEVHDATGGLA
jgi:hypothetical protein